MNNVVKILMERDNLSLAEAEAAVNEAKQAVLDGENPEEVLEDHFGLEPDYIYDLI